MDKRDPDMTLITDEEMLEITGAHFPTKQCQILKEHGIAFVRRLDGRPRTTWFNFNNPLHTRNHIPAEEEKVEPNFDAIFVDTRPRRKSK